MTVGKKSGIAMESKVGSGMEQRASSGNLQSGTLAEKLISERNVKRNMQHLGMVPPSGTGKF